MSAPFPENPFRRLGFWGRQHELKMICNRLISEPSQHCVIIGEIGIGKTTLLRYLADPQGVSIVDDLKIKNKFTFIYLDCDSYTRLTNLGDYTSAHFWWELYGRLLSTLQPHEQLTIPKPRSSTDQAAIESAFDTKSEMEDLLRKYKQRVVIILDNFEGIARLPLRDSQWLRSLGQDFCTYIVASRHLLYLLYRYDPKESQLSPSPLYNIFSDPIYLGLMAEDEVDVFLLQISRIAKKQGSHWEQKDLDKIKRMVGRHPELIRIACVRLFEHRLMSRQLADDEFLEISIRRDASPICQKLWDGLADPELRGEPGVIGSRGEIQIPSPHQKVMIALAKGCNTTEEILMALGEDVIEQDKDVLFVLEQRGLIERINGKWCLFAEVMRQFILKQERAYKAPASVDIDQKILRSLHTEAASVHHIPISRSQPLIHIPAVPAMTPVDASIEKRQARAFTHLEGKVYDYLKSHAGEVCDKEEIKSAVWENNPPGDSALQKIIERIREKIEEDPENPRYLLAVRGQGYMLRENSIIAS